MEIKLINGSIFKTFVNMKNIKNSLQLDSGQTICSLENDFVKTIIEVNGDVKIWWNPNGDPRDGDYYTKPSEFPEELKKIIAEDKWFDTNKHVEVDFNNWFEIFFIDKATNEFAAEDVADIEGYDDKELLFTCLDFEHDVIRNYTDRKNI